MIPRPDPGPVPLSDGLFLLLRVCRLLHERHEWLRPLLTPERHAISLRFLGEVETTRDVVLPHDLVALAFLRIPLFERVTGLCVEQLFEIQLDCAGKPGPAPKGWMSIATFSSRGLDDLNARDTARDEALCIRRDGPRKGEPFVRTVARQRGTERPIPLSKYVLGRLATKLGTAVPFCALRADAAADERPLEPTFTPFYVDDLVKPAREKRARHPLFGPGRVVREVDDKLDVVFDDGRTRTVLRHVLDVE